MLDKVTNVDTPEVTDKLYSAFLRGLFLTSLKAVDPLNLVPPHLPSVPKGRTVVIGAGKASARMALAVERNWTADLSGLVVTRYGHEEDCSQIEVVQAAHPVPDEAGNEVAKRMLNLVSNLTEDDLVICLISGGGSALLSLPIDGITVEDKRQLNRDLLKSGASISEMNCVRRHLSAVKGGRLALACYPAPVVTLVISDVPGDDPSVVASGPTFPDWSTSEQAAQILEKYKINVSPNVMAALFNETTRAPKPDDKGLARNRTMVIGTAMDALRGAAQAADRAGVLPLVLGGAIEGEASTVAREHADMVREIAAKDSVKRPYVILSGGETTVTVKGGGRGGRNVEFLLALAIELDGMPGVYALAADTDGIDGTEAIAGAIAEPDTLRRASELGKDASTFLGENDAYSFFARLGDTVFTGPTKTNVNDFRAILITDTNADDKAGRQILDSLGEHRGLSDNAEHPRRRT
ncbi:glycerate kinase [Noviherbaspirillum saxi]|uniref:Glycerate kinase n=2 Tax=Noviherbaspirillum saxi TaxID=2320863 RepID=A0A3A3G426_9BURK|nr:glycerate kinase [Noviherbaspirillum saxi]